MSTVHAEPSLRALENFIVFANPALVDVVALRASHAWRKTPGVSTEATSQEATHAIDEATVRGKGVEKVEVEVEHCKDDAEHCEMGSSSSSSSSSGSSSSSYKRQRTDARSSDAHDVEGSSTDARPALPALPTLPPPITLRTGQTWQLGPVVRFDRPMHTLIIGPKCSGKTTAVASLLRAWSPRLETAVLFSSSLPRTALGVPAAFQSGLDSATSIKNKVQWVTENALREPWRLPVCFVFDDFQNLWKAEKAEVSESLTGGRSAGRGDAAAPWICASQSFEDVPIALRSSAQLVFLSVSCKGEKELSRRRETWAPHCPPAVWNAIFESLSARKPRGFLIIFTASAAAHSADSDPTKGMLTWEEDVPPPSSASSTSSPTSVCGNRWYGDLSTRFAKHRPPPPQLNPWTFTEGFEGAKGRSPA